MDYVINFMNASLNPAEWARRREAEGWTHLSVADHFYTPGHPFPHVWVTAGAMAAATTTATITTAFVNNLLRSPVEVAQAALMMQHTSDGRFELGLGAGWARAEIHGAGLDYPEPRDRAGSFAEAAQIVRELMHTGRCQFDGEYHRLDVDAIGPVGATPPLLVAAVGGPRTIREVTPHCDRVELKPASSATRGGALDFERMAEVTVDDLKHMMDRVKAVNPDIGIGMFAFCSAGDDERTRAIGAGLGDSLYGGLYGPPEKVAENLAALGELGISRCQVSPIDDSSFDRLAPLLHG